GAGPVHAVAHQRRHGAGDEGDRVRGLLPLGRAGPGDRVAEREQRGGHLLEAGGPEGGRGAGGRGQPERDGQQALEDAAAGQDAGVRQLAGHAAGLRGGEGGAD
ncbi:hypothetical protein EG873_15885, partial [Enterococcus faecalis]